MNKYIVSFLNNVTGYEFKEEFYARDEVTAAVLCVYNEADVEISETIDRSAYELDDFIYEMEDNHDCVVRVTEVIQA